jgi:hypothetical protein
LLLSVAQVRQNEPKLLSLNDVRTDICFIEETAAASPSVEFIDENGGGPGLRLRKPQRAKHK